MLSGSDTAEGILQLLVGAVDSTALNDALASRIHERKRSLKRSSESRQEEFWPNKLYLFVAMVSYTLSRNPLVTDGQKGGTKEEGSGSHE